MADLAVAIADGATTFSGFDVLGESAELYGPIASVPTAWRCLAEIGERELARIDRATARMRRHVWGLIEARPGGVAGGLERAAPSSAGQEKRPL